MNIETHLTATEACTLIAHEAVSMLDAVQEEIPQSVREYRTALEALTTVHNLGKDGETLLGWLDTEIANAERYAAEGINLPYLIDMCRLDAEPDAMAQMDLVWLLFDTAAMEECGPEQRRALLGTARTITEVCGLDDLLLATVKPDTAKLAAGLRDELDDVHTALQASTVPRVGTAQQEMG